MNQNGGERIAAWQPTDDNDDRHICKKEGKGRNQAAAATRIRGGQRSQSITTQAARHVTGLDGREKKGEKLPEG